MKKPQGIILNKSKSLFNGKNIIAIATGIKNKTENPKIGDMIPIWIIRPDISPVIAFKIGYNESYCPKNCRHRHWNSCYVNVHQGPNQVFKAYHNDRYVNYTPDMLELFRDKYIRIGSVGDIASMNIKVWENLFPVVKGFTAYSHAWNDCNQDLKNYAMASCDNLEDYYKAQDMGWRTFRTLTPNENKLDNEIICPASKEAGQLTTCHKCNLCNGLESKNKKSVVIIAHGGGAYSWRSANFIKGRKKLKNKKKWQVDFGERKRILLGG